MVNVTLGLDTDMGDLDADWVLVHELIHLSFPQGPEAASLGRGGPGRLRRVGFAGTGGRRRADGDVAAFLRRHAERPSGQGDRGLDFTPTWGRTYWGGALFYLLADIDIIRRTGGEKSLQDALRAGGRSRLQHTGQQGADGGFQRDGPGCRYAGAVGGVPAARAACGTAGPGPSCGAGWGSNAPDRESGSTMTRSGRLSGNVLFARPQGSK